jgi:glycosyltransferase involved in cell wall biosynthesis
MNVLIINTSDINGGAAIAAYRLLDALKSSGVNAQMVVRDKLSDNKNVLKTGNNLINKFNFYHERGEIFLSNAFSIENLFEISIAKRGIPITETEEFKQADIVHLHWINQGMLSVGEIKKILSSGKKVVWTLHDMWPFTGICHYAGDCTFYTDSCGNCPLLKGRSNNDLSRSTYRRKMSAYSKGEINFVACSNWLKEMALKSALTAGHYISSIPNPINTDIYRPLNKSAIRKELNLPFDKKIILFAAAKASDKRKGLDYLVEASHLLKNHSKDIIFLIAGNRSQEIEKKFALPVISMGYIAPENMPALYNAADLFVSPSLQDNLPNTIMESMSCGTPCIGFNTGGIPQMIDHLINGYISKYKDPQDLAKGISWILFNNDINQLKEYARKKVVENYSNEIVARQYIEIYKNARG